MTDKTDADQLQFQTTSEYPFQVISCVNMQVFKIVQVISPLVQFHT